ncbi:MAG: biotin--[acetyl-CoA-carboxylase] ligase [Bacteroidetes bacterium]|nr:biotin--[acetyl-CoA-carboxylase] ligase [Bacteroidota bacterium]
MALDVIGLLAAPIIELHTVDSTNNYAMQLIDADTAQAGLTVTAWEQTAGKGQRGRHWAGVPGQSLLMSLIIAPQQSLEEQFVFSAGVAVAVAQSLESLYEGWNIMVKWPNDIIVNDKKAGGILIENILRGSKWIYSVVGLGLNVLQDSFPPELPYATSLKINSSKSFNLVVLRDMLRSSIFDKLSGKIHADEIMRQYNGLLYRRGLEQAFSDGHTEWKGIIVKANTDGQLMVQLENGRMATYKHGDVVWMW